MTGGDFTKQMARFVLTSAERFASARAIGKWRQSTKRGLADIEALKLACRNGGIDLEAGDWVRLAALMTAHTTSELSREIWEAEKLRQLRRASETLRVRGAARWHAVLSDGTRIPTNESVIAHYRRAYGAKFPIEFERADDDEAPDEP